MNAVVPMQQKAAPPSAEQLKAALAVTERELIEVKRMNSAARTALAGHIAGGDPAAVAACRREIAMSGTKMKELAEVLEASRDAIKLAVARDSAVTSAQSYRLIEKSVSDAREDLATLGDTIVAFANALKKAGGAVDSVDSLMRRRGVMPDPFVLKAKFHALVDMALHLETGGVFGRSHTLDNPHQLRQSGRCDLARIGAEYQALYLQRARATLHITE